jgi:hypothetical protein
MNVLHLYNCDSFSSVQPLGVWPLEMPVFMGDLKPNVEPMIFFGTAIIDRNMCPAVGDLTFVFTERFCGKLPMDIPEAMFSSLDWIFCAPDPAPVHQLILMRCSCAEGTIYSYLHEHDSWPLDPIDKRYPYTTMSIQEMDRLEWYLEVEERKKAEAVADGI